MKTKSFEEYVQLRDEQLGEAKGRSGWGGWISRLGTAIDKTGMKYFGKAWDAGGYDRIAQSTNSMDDCIATLSKISNDKTAIQNTCAKVHDSANYQHLSKSGEPRTL